MESTWVSSKPEAAKRPDAAEIRQALALVLESSCFRGSRRCHDFLAYVVAKSLEGDADNLKERRLAVDVFGRKADAHLSEDSIVRVGAREVRKRLLQYYGGEGANDLVRIELPAGSYVPSFHWQTDAAVPAAVPAVEPEPIVEPAPPRRRNLRWAIAAAAVLGIAAPLLGWRMLHHPTEEFDAFWKPVFEQRQPVLIALAHPIVYHPSAAANRLNDERNGVPATPLQRPLHLPPEVVDGSDFVPDFD